MSLSTERNILINSSLIRISSGLLTTIIHELGHFFVSILLGNSATLYHNRVETHGENLDFLNQLLIPMGGPIVSLLQGIFCMLIYKKAKNGIASLLLLWLGIGGLMGFFGYMMIAPMFTIGDTGRIFELLEIPMGWQITLASISLLLFTFLLMKFHRYFEHFIPENITDEKTKRVKWAKILILYPVLIGIAVTSIMQFPVVYFLSILPSLTMPFMLFMVYGMMIMSKNTVDKKENKNVSELSIPIIVLFILTIIAFRLLVYGFTW